MGCNVFILQTNILLFTSAEWNIANIHTRLLHSTGLQYTMRCLNCVVVDAKWQSIIGNGNELTGGNWVSNGDR